MSQPYTDFELYQIIRDTREICDKSYMLFAAFAISSLQELVADDDGQEIWGAKVPQKILDKFVLNIAEDFDSAAKNRLPVVIFGKSFSIRRPNTFCAKNLLKIFSFPLENGYYTIVKDGIMNLGSSELPKTKEAKAELRESRDYFRKIVKVAEDDENDGWDKLTDMEAGYYCWGLFFCKTLRDSFTEFYQQYKDYIGLSETELKKGLNEKAKIMGTTQGLYSFSAKAIRNWNEANGQVSIVDEVSSEEASDYWYNNAKAKFFKHLT